MTDVVCTSANALKIVNSFPPEQKLIFAPDKNWETTSTALPERNGSLGRRLHGSRKYSVEKIIEADGSASDAEFIAHPECEKPVLLVAKYIGSTTALLNYVTTSPKKKFIVATESGILHQMNKACPDKIFIPAPSIDSTCGCNDCSYMKLNSLQNYTSA